MRDILIQAANVDITEANVRGFSGSTLYRVERDDRGVVWTFTEALCRRF